MLERGGILVIACVCDCFFLFSARRFERAIRKRPNTVRCLAVKSTSLGIRHPRKEKEAALQNKLWSLLACAKGFQTSIYLQKSASIKPRTGLSKFAKNWPKVRKQLE